MSDFFFIKKVCNSLSILSIINYFVFIILIKYLGFIEFARFIQSQTNNPVLYWQNKENDDCASLHILIFFEIILILYLNNLLQTYVGYYDRKLSILKHHRAFSFFFLHLFLYQFLLYLFKSPPIDDFN